MKPSPSPKFTRLFDILENPSSASFPNPDKLPNGGPAVALPANYASYRCSAKDEHFNGYLLAHAYKRLTDRIDFDVPGTLLQNVPLLLPARREFGDVRTSFEAAARIAFPTHKAIETAVSDSFAEVGVFANTRRTDKCPNGGA